LDAAVIVRIISIHVSNINFNYLHNMIIATCCVEAWIWSCLRVAQAEMSLYVAKQKYMTYYYLASKANLFITQFENLTTIALSLCGVLVTYLDMLNAPLQAR